MVQFKVYKEMAPCSCYDSCPCNSRWSLWGYTKSINIEDISVQTQALTNVVAYGDTPYIAPFGVKGKDGRVANITGTYKDASMKFQSSLLPSGFEVISIQKKGPSGIVLNGMAIKVIGDGLPELGDALWTINNITWDRQAMEGGMWRFKLQLGYVWDVTKNELKLYEDGVGTNVKDNVKFFVIKEENCCRCSCKNERVYINNPKIETTLHDLNRARFTLPYKTYEKEDILKIYCDTDESNAVFYGIVTNVSNSSNSAIQYECTEIGTLLYRKPCAKLGAGIFKPRIRIPNPYKGVQLTLQQIIGTILKFYQDSPIKGYNPGPGNDKTGKWGASPWLPGREDDAYLPPQILSGFTVGKALDNVLNEQCGLHTWFDNNTGHLEYGFYRNIVTIDPATDYIIYSEQIQSLAEEYQADGVILMDNSANNPTRYPAGSNTGTYIQYQFSSDLTNEQLSSIAKRIYNDIRLANRDTFKVKFPAGTVKFRDGDVFSGLGDSTVTPRLPYRGGVDQDPTEDPSDSCWQIREMVITDTYTECTVGSTYFSIFDIYRTALKRYDGCPAPIETKDTETNVYALPARESTNT